MIFANPDFSITDTYFLIDCGEENEAERYVLLREADVNGDYYESVGELAKQLEKSGLIHAAMIAYRALLDSILKRGRTKAYYYGARYLKKLDTMAAAVEDWRGIENHEFYFESLKQDTAENTVSGRNMRNRRFVGQRILYSLAKKLGETRIV